MQSDGQRIDEAGGTIDIGPGCFGLADGSLINWDGVNYVPQKPTLRVRLHNWWVEFWNRQNNDAPISGVDRRPVTKVDEKDIPPPSGPFRSVQ